MAPILEDSLKLTKNSPSLHQMCRSPGFMMRSVGFLIDSASLTWKEHRGPLMGAVWTEQRSPVGLPFCLPVFLPFSLGSALLFPRAFLLRVTVCCSLSHVISASLVSLAQEVWAPEDVGVHRSLLQWQRTCPEAEQAFLPLVCLPAALALVLVQRLWCQARPPQPALPALGAAGSQDLARAQGA